MGKRDSLVGWCLVVYSVLMVLAFWGAFLAGFFYYGFLSDESCHASQNKDLFEPFMGDGDAPDGYKDVARNFRVVCIMGFFLYLFILVLLALLLFIKKIGEDCVESLAAVFAVCLPTLWLAWFLTLLIMRARHAGKVCAGAFIDEVENPFRRSEFYAEGAGAFLYYVGWSQLALFFMFVSGAGIAGGFEMGY